MWKLVCVQIPLYSNCQIVIKGNMDDDDDEEEDEDYDSDEASEDDEGEESDDEVQTSKK